jgi:hypothetical protein
MTHDPSPSPRRHGGRRPGAGARPGNINALKGAQRSTRYAEAEVFLTLLTVLCPASLSEGARPTRRLRHRNLEAARWVVSTPAVYSYVREQVLSYVQSPGCALAKARLLEFALKQPKRSDDWPVLAGMVIYIRKHDPAFGNAFAQHLDTWFSAGLTATKEKTTRVPSKRSNNQVGESGEAEKVDRS